VLVEYCRLIKLPQSSDSRGHLTYLEAPGHIPFPIARVFYITDVPEGQTRGSHAHRQLHQFLICVAGEFDIVCDDSDCRREFHLSDAGEGLYVPPLIWNSETNFRRGSVCLVLASAPYDESDYLRNYEEFKEAIRESRTKSGLISIACSAKHVGLSNGQ
jgi:dTDP-4-dehydrorhamnose 3,5-epimerase-like enzyme